MPQEFWEKREGASEYFGLKDAVDISMGTLSKAFGVEGDKAKSFIYSTAPPPHNMAAAFPCG